MPPKKIATASKGTKTKAPTVSTVPATKGKGKSTKTVSKTPVVGKGTGISKKKISAPASAVKGKTTAAKSTKSVAAGKKPTATTPKKTSPAAGKSTGKKKAAAPTTHNDDEYTEERASVPNDGSLQVYVPSFKTMQSKTQLLFEGKKPSFRAAATGVHTSEAAADVDDEEIEGDDGFEHKNIVRYDPSKTISRYNSELGQYEDVCKYKKIYNVLGGKSGEGLCYRNGVVRMQGKLFRRRLREHSDAFLLEFVKKAHHFSKVANGRKTVTVSDVLNVGKTMGCRVLTA